MKRVLIGGFLTLAGVLLCLPIIVFTGNNMVSAWSTPPGRFATTLNETGMLLPLVVSALIFLCGMVIMGVEYFKKDK